MPKDHKKFLKEYEKNLLGSNERWPKDVNRVLNLLNDAVFQQTVAISKILNQSHVYSKNFSSKFKFYIGHTPKSYITHHRLEAAKFIFNNYKLKDIKVSEIGFCIGYRSHASFSAAFKSYVGISPSSYLMELKIK